MCDLTERKQKSCEHLGDFKVGRSSLKIELKSSLLTQTGLRVAL